MAGHEEESAIAVRGLTRRFGRQAAVDAVDLDVHAGSTTALIGINGAGKSTLVRMIVGLLPPTSGTVRVLGAEVREEPMRVRASVGYVPDRPTVYPWMRVSEVMEFCRVLRPGWDAGYAAGLVKMFGLAERKKVKQLSKGQAAKLSLVTAVAFRPRVLVLDEPTDGMDPLARDEFLDGVLRTVTEEDQDAGRAVLLSSHALGEVQRLADRVAIMHAGRMIHCGSLDELLMGSKRIRVVLSDEVDGGTPALPAPPAPPAPPSGTVWHRRDRREWTITVRGFSAAVVEEIKAKNAVANVEVFDVSLDDLFKDMIRARQGESAKEAA